LTLERKTMARSDGASGPSMAGTFSPNMAACEAAEESNYGQSALARMTNNLFGMKQHQHPVYGTISLPTREFLGGSWKVVSANFVEYPDIKTCFQDRMATLKHLSGSYPHYATGSGGPRSIRVTSSR